MPKKYTGLEAKPDTADTRDSLAAQGIRLIRKFNIIKAYNFRMHGSMYNYYIHT
jgi:hypothetical protein